jgi:DNA polymerase III epsilon subunit-like protein
MYAFIDIETNGTDYNYHEAIEIGIVVGDEEFECSLPFQLSRSNPKAMEVNGWGKREFAPLMHPIDAAVQIAAFTDNCYLVGQNVRFDERFVDNFLRAQGVIPQWNFRLVELSSLVAGVQGLMPPIKSSEITAITGIENKYKHTALGDAKWDRDIFNWCMGKSGNRDWRDG